MALSAKLNIAQASQLRAQKKVSGLGTDSAPPHALHAARAAPPFQCWRTASQLPAHRCRVLVSDAPQATRASVACPAVASAEGVRKAAASLALAGVLALGDVSEASARVVEPYAGLTPCGAWAVLGEGRQQSGSGRRPTRCSASPHSSAARPATRPARARRRGGSGGRRAGRLVDCTQLRAHALPPATSAAFAKREKNEVKTLTKRLKNVRPRCRRLGVCRAALSEIIQLLCAPHSLRRLQAAASSPALGLLDAAPPACRLKSLLLCFSAATLTPRARQFEADSAPALALNATIEKTHTRFKNYAEQGLLCGADGLPHLIVDGNLQHLGEFTYPGLGFLYVAGWIGYAGRSYVMKNKLSAKPLDGEIIIDVPGALNIMFASAGWPLLAAREWQKGTLLEDDANITVSPR